MLGPYLANSDGTVSYKGNKIFSKVENVHKIPVSKDELEQRVFSIHKNNYWSNISRINNTINTSATNYFNELGALFTPLPMITRLISSPGAVYGKEAINYTTDTCPITLEWFDLPSKAFLAESSQIYLEFALLQSGVDHVFANYNSFRKEPSDSTHLSEFHHIEYEGHVNQKQNQKILSDFYRRCIADLLKNNETDLAIFLSGEKLRELEIESGKEIQEIKFTDAMKELYMQTKNDKYLKNSLQEFGSWEETMLTQIVGGTVFVTEMPLLEVPFYHAMKEGITPAVANNADLIGAGYREMAGSGQRIKSLKELKEKAVIFNLPKSDYEPYLQSRQFPDFKETSGFGLGWERFIQMVLETPFIHSASLFPRVHNTLKP